MELACRIVLTLLSIALVPGAVADVVSIQAAKDNTLYESPFGELSNGKGPGFFAGRTGTGGIRRGLLGFDIAGSIPAGATIHSASLQLYMSQTVAGPVNVTLRRALQDWGEGTSNAGPSGGMGAEATPGDATWLHTFFPSSNWATNGGNLAGVVSATTSVAGVAFYSFSSSQLLADVIDMRNAPGSNFGWAVVGDESTLGTAKRFDTREGLTPERRPVLIVNYSLAQIVHPTSYVVLQGIDRAPNLAALFLSDNVRIQVNTQVELAYENLVEFRGTSPSVSPTRLKFHLESSCNLADRVRHIQFFDYSSGQWEEVGSEPNPLTDGPMLVDIGVNPGRFVQFGTQAMLARLRVVQTNGRPALKKQLDLIDRAVWEVE